MKLGKVTIINKALSEKAIDNFYLSPMYFFFFANIIQLVIYLLIIYSEIFLIQDNI